jgi:hypothetical protein
MGILDTARGHAPQTVIGFHGLSAYCQLARSYVPSLPQLMGACVLAAGRACAGEGEDG